MKIYYDSKLKQLSRVLRKNKSTSETLLWKHIKGKQINGYQFTRQKPIGNYIVDFYCSKLKLVVELDGNSHFGQNIPDEIRQKYLESVGLNILRFNNDDVKKDVHGICNEINSWILKQTLPTSPLTKGD